MNWADAQSFARGPMFNIALLIFIGGLAYRLISVLMLGWRRDHYKPKGSRVGGGIVYMLKGWLIFPFVPRLHEGASRNPVTYIAGGIFHVSLFAVIFLGAAHMLVWESLLGFRWPTLPLPIIDLLAALGIGAMFVLFINRMYSPVLRLLSRASDYLNLLVVFLPFLTGFFMTHRLLLPYEQMFTIHVMSVNIMLIWIPFSRISHFVFYFITRPRWGANFAARGARP